jgi:hypothetical protein
LDVEAKAAGGLALGSTTNPDESGSPRAGALGGVGIDMYLLTVGPVDLGLSVGAEYDYLTFHGVLNNYLSGAGFGPGITQTSDSIYNYLDFPVSIVGRFPLSPSVSVTLRAGAFIGHFLGGSSTLSYTNNGAPALVYEGFLLSPANVTSQTLNSSTTLVGEYGLHFTGGVDIAISKTLLLAPALQFDVGLTNTSAVNPATGTGAYPYSDTFWTLTAAIGIKYKVF